MYFRGKDIIVINNISTPSGGLFIGNLLMLNSRYDIRQIQLICKLVDWIAELHTPRLDSLIYLQVPSSLRVGAGGMFL